MSFSFYISLPEPPSFPRLHDALVREVGEALMWEGVPEDEPWPDDHYAHAYLWNLSTRSVEMGWIDDSLQIRIMSCSCTEDYELALTAVQLVGTWFDAEIEPESGETTSADRLREEFTDDWVAQMVESGATVIPRMLESGTITGPLTLPGPERDFVIGDRVLAELAGPEDSFVDRLFTKIREVRYFDPAEEYFHANMMQLTPEGGEPVLFAVWGPGVSYVFPDVKLFAVPCDPTMFVPYDKLVELAGDSCRRLDERQLVVEAIDDEEWDALVDAAREHAVDPALFNPA